MPVMSSRLTSIRMSTTAFETIAAEAPRSADGRETGGALFGFDADIYGPILVTHATGPGPKAERKRDVFSRDLEYTKPASEVAYAECCARWIGEWHTHPDGPPMPSSRDLTSYLTHLDDPDLGFITFLSLIVVPDDSAWTGATVLAWEIDREEMWLRTIGLTPDAEALEEALRRASPTEGET
jgi:integrative and conjugative element protein (TIGR02256 family)